MLGWPDRAREAIAWLFRPLQDVDVYVEDVGDEAFYTQLFQRIANGKPRIARVIAAGNRMAVVNAARTHDFASRAALFLVDGDLEWVRGEAPPQVAGVHRLDAYCIENVLLTEQAAIQVLTDAESISEIEAKGRLKFTQWLADIEAPLVELFLAFAILNHVDATQPTVSTGVGAVITGAPGALPRLDAAKVMAIVSNVMSAVEHQVGKAEAQRRLTEVRTRAADLPRIIDVVSGKDFLFPLFEFQLRTCTRDRPTRKSLRFRLARHCDCSKLVSLKTALERAARGGAV